MHHILCESPSISGDFYAIRPLILWHILGAYFWLGVGVVKSVFRIVLQRTAKGGGAKHALALGGANPIANSSL